MPGGRRWAWKQLPSDRLHVLTLSSAVGSSLRHESSCTAPMAAAVGRRFSRSGIAACRQRDARLAGAQANRRHRPVPATRPRLAVPETMRAVSEAASSRGRTRFRSKRQATELEARLGELSDALRGGPARVAAVTSSLLDPGFRGARLLPRR